MRKFGMFLHSTLTPLAVLLLAGVAIHDHSEPQGRSSAQPAVNGMALGRSFAPIVTSNLGDGWLAAAQALEHGQSIADAQAAFQSTWQEARVRSFSAKIAPEFAKVLPEGQEPTDPTTRAQVVQLWRDFASGLKGGR